MAFTWNHKRTVESSYLGVLAVLVAVIVLKQFIWQGYYSVLHDDTITYVRWAREFQEGLAEGIAYPRWLPGEAWNYGSPTFLLYSPLAFYLAAASSYCLGSTIAGMNLVRSLSLLFSVIGIYLFLREFHRPKSAFLTALLFLLYPFNVQQIYIFGSFASTVSTMFYAPILLNLLRFHRQRKRSSLICAGFCFAGLVLTHLINAYMFTFVLAAFAAFMVARKRRVGDLLALPAVLLIGGLLAAGYLLPLCLERNHLQLSAFVTQGTGYLYSFYFLLPDRTGLLSPSLFWPRFHPQFLFHAALLLAILGYAGAQLLRRGKLCETDREAIGLTKVFLVLSTCTLLPMFGLSNWLWKSVPFFSYIQFPYRWLHLALFTILPVVAFCLDGKERRTKPPRFALLIALAVTAMVVVDEYYIDRANRFTEEELRAAPQPFPQEHLPKGVDLDRIKKLPAMRSEIVAGTGRAEVTGWKSAARTVDVAAQTEVTVRVRTFAFPGWTASVEGRRLELLSESGTGAILVTVPPGRHRLKLSFEDTPVRVLGKGVSLASLLCLGLMLLPGKQAGPIRERGELTIGGD